MISKIINGFNKYFDFSNCSHKQILPFSNTSKIALVAFTAVACAAIVIVDLNAMRIFGAAKSVGFIGSVVGGGVSLCLAMGGIWIVFKKQEDREEEHARASHAHMALG